MYIYNFVQWVMRAVERQMMAVARTEFTPVASSLWAALDDAICLRECEIYSYNPGESAIHVGLGPF